MEAIAFLLLVGIVLLVYFLPSIIASVRLHRNTAAIIGLNVLGGWTLLGWVIAFVWALTANVNAPAATHGLSTVYKDGIAVE